MALGLCIFILWFTVFVLSLVCPPLMTEQSLGPTNVFFIFCGLSVIATVYVYFFIKESKHLNDKEKKTMFVPEKYLHEFRAMGDM